jgi:hypothetical protein
MCFLKMVVSTGGGEAMTHSPLGACVGAIVMPDQIWGRFKEAGMGIGVGVVKPVFPRLVDIPKYF